MNSITSTAVTTPDYHATEGSVSLSTDNHIVNRMLELTNQERRKHGLQPLVLNARLTAAAQAHSKAMALHDQGLPPNVKRMPLGDRAARTGYGWSVIGENIAHGHVTPEAVMLAWMEGDGERKNILNPEFREIGIGYYFLRDDAGRVNEHHYWVQTLAIPK